MQIKILQEKPFYIFEVEEFLSDKEHDVLNNHFPEVEKEKLTDGLGNKLKFDNRDQIYKDLEINGNKSIEILKKKFDENFFLTLTKKLKKQLIQSRFSSFTNLQSLKNLIALIRKTKIVDKNIKKNLFQKIFYSNYQYTFEFSYMSKNSFLLPHTDKPSKLVSLMLYFPTKGLENLDIGTTFYNSKFKNFKSTPSFSTFEERISFYEKNLDETFTFPFKKKNLYGFIKSDLSWHSVKKLEIPEDEVRKSININLKI